MWFKSCEKCGGDFYIEEDGRFRDLVCLQCGYRPSNGEARIASAHGSVRRPRLAGAGL